MHYWLFVCVCVCVWLSIAVLKGIRHPNIVTFIGISRDQKDGSLYLVTEWLENGDINSLVKVQLVCFWFIFLCVCAVFVLLLTFSTKKSSLPLPLLKRVCYARDVSVAMSYLHSKQIVHRYVCVCWWCYSNSTHIFVSLSATSKVKIFYSPWIAHRLKYVIWVCCFCLAQSVPCCLLCLV